MSEPVSQTHSLANQSAPSVRVTTRAPLTRLARARQERFATWFFVGIPLAVYAVFVVLPIAYMVYLSLNDWDGLGAMTFTGLDNYVRVFRDERFWISIQHNVIWALATLFGTTMLGLLLALLLARTRAWGRGFFQIVYFLPQMISSVVIAIMWRWIYYPTDGPLNVALSSLGLGFLQHTWLGETQTVLPALFVAYTWVAYGFAMLTFLTAIDSVDPNLLDAAKIDGANWFKETWYVLLPAVRPALTTVFIIMGIWSFQVFNLVWLTTRGGPGYSSSVLALQIYRSTFVERNIGMGSALATILSLIILVLAFFTLRRTNDEAL
ncbi:MAG TPA: sugar ABC transporter permease [Anaerolineae bacterium]|nr:sugar ABC transporter permease [Anaerolineae bacterium]